jgi:hypothetical protein
MLNAFMPGDHRALWDYAQLLMTLCLTYGANNAPLVFDQTGNVWEESWKFGFRTITHAAADFDARYPGMLPSYMLHHVTVYRRP